MTRASNQASDPAQAIDPRQVLLVGHRATGKTTTGQIAADELGWDFVDLDHYIERQTGQRPAAIIADSEARFRRLERQYLTQLLDRPYGDGQVIVLGGGCELLPTSALCVWLWREGWAQSAKLARARLRPDWPFAREVEWMRDTREPRWQKAAHLRLHVPRARPPRFAAEILASYLRWAASAGDGALARRTWMVPGGPDEFARALRDARGLGLAGVEVRSDLFDGPPEAGDAILASLRTPDADWLDALSEADAFDVDVRFADALFEAELLTRAEPTTLLLSSHPDDVDRASVDELFQEADRLAERAPAWADHLVLKYAPSPSSVAELARAVRLADWLRNGPYETTFLPQGRRFAWLRPILAHRHNATNYLTVGLRPTRLPDADRETIPSSMDLQDWLPHLAGPTPATFDGLIGDPVDASIGDWWHTRRARRNGEETGYVKITAGRQLSGGELSELFDLLHQLDVRGLSVTSPLKRRVVEFVDNPRGLEAVNTLRRTDPGWTSTDTDERGMIASLEALAEFGVSPGEVAVIGRGGVSPAVRRAIDRSSWRLVHHAGARAGWGQDRPERVALVVNAAGANSAARTDPPECEAWLDLHYHDVDAPPDNVRVHLNGDVFFVAQAEAQRDVWREST